MSEDTRRFILRNDDIRANAVMCLQQLVIDEQHPVEVTVKAYKAKRSLAQNSLYWMWLRLIQQHILDSTGQQYADNDLHEFFKQKFLPSRVVEVAGDVRRCRKSTAALKVHEMTEYLNQLDQYCAENLSLVLPHPSDLYVEAMGRGHVPELWGVEMLLIPCAPTPTK